MRDVGAQRRNPSSKISGPNQWTELWTKFFNLPWSLSWCLSYAKEHHRCLNFIRIKHDSRDILLGTVREQDHDIA